MDIAVKKEQTCCLTGHRHIPPEHRGAVLNRLIEAVYQRIGEGYRFFCTGSAPGFETMAAQTVLSLRQLYPEIKLILALPAASPADNRPEEDRAAYRQLLEQADSVARLPQEYTQDTTPHHSRALVDRSSACICYLTRQSGETARTVRYAKEQALRIYNICDLIDS